MSNEISFLMEQDMRYLGLKVLKRCANCGKICVVQVNSNCSIDPTVRISLNSYVTAKDSSRVYCHDCVLKCANMLDLEK